jgi:hypothetical protein
MSGIPCKVCGKIRKIDIILASDGWHQPPCYNCGDPGYIEPVENYRVNPELKDTDTVEDIVTTIEYKIVMTRDDLEDMMGQRLFDWQWEYAQNILRRNDDRSKTDDG